MTTEVDKAYIQGQEAYRQDLSDSQEIQRKDHERFMAVIDREFEVLALQEQAAKLAIQFYRHKLDKTYIGRKYHNA